MTFFLICTVEFGQIYKKQLNCCFLYHCYEKTIHKCRPYEYFKPASENAEWWTDTSPRKQFGWLDSLSVYIVACEVGTWDTGPNDAFKCPTAVENCITEAALRMGVPKTVCTNCRRQQFLSLSAAKRTGTCKYYQKGRYLYKQASIIHDLVSKARHF